MSRNFTYTTRRLIVRPLRYTDFSSCQKTKRNSQLTDAEASGDMLAVSHDNVSTFRVMVDYRRMLMEQDDEYWFGVFTKSKKEFVGEVMLYGVARGIHPHAVVGANICSPFRRRGYANEAMRGLARYAFGPLKLHRVEAQVDPANYASVAMCQKVGYRLEGVSARRINENSQWRDRVILAITREDL